MALRKNKDDKRAPEAGGVAVEEQPGESVEECVALDQCLAERHALFDGWKRAVERSRNWYEDPAPS